MTASRAPATTVITRWLQARAGQVSLVTHDLTHHVRPPAGPSFTFAVTAVLVLLFLWKVALPAILKK
jgi:hypothetical protein